MTDSKQPNPPGVCALVPGNFNEAHRFAASIASSGFFGVARSKEQFEELSAQALVKICRGMEMGIPPMTAVMGMHVIEGKPSLSAGLIASRIRMHPRYDYRMVEWTDDACELVIVDRERRDPNPSVRVTLEQFVASGLATAKGGGLKKNWKQSPSAMLFARCISRAGRAYCPDALMGPVYTPGEIEDQKEAAARPAPSEVIDVEATVIEDKPGPAAASDEQLERIAIQAKDLGLSHGLFSARLKQLFGVERTSGLTAEQAADLIQRLETSIDLQARTLAVAKRLEGLTGDLFDEGQDLLAKLEQTKAAVAELEDWTTTALELGAEQERLDAEERQGNIVRENADAQADQGDELDHGAVDAVGV